jgi:hypothetical protein
LGTASPHLKASTQGQINTSNGDKLYVYPRLGFKPTIPVS